MADHWTENESTLSEETKNISRAVKTLIEELEATMFYQQRVDVTNDTALREIMAHNRDEEIEHACMTLEWLRRNMDGWDKELRTYLFSEGSLLDVEGQADDSEVSSTDNESLNIGSLK
jgi:ferritin-like protein